jgi:GlcNAc-P-P-Und epimerase
LHDLDVDSKYQLRTSKLLYEVCVESGLQPASHSSKIRERSIIVMPKKAIVFGGAGFIGSHFLQRLSDSGRYDGLFSVDIATPRFFVPGVQYLEFDVRMPIPIDLCGTALFDIYNFSAVHITPGHEDWEYYWTNVHGATNVCRFASDAGAERILFTSTMMVYGPTEAPKGEDGALEPVNAYGRSKILAEGIHRLWQSERADARRLTIVRPGVIYGLAERGNFTRLARALSARRFVYPARTDTIKACGYIDDLVSSMVQMERGKPGVFLYNFCHPERYTTADICKAFSNVADYPRPRLVIPYWLLGLIALGFELLSGLGLRTDINRARVRKLYQSTNMVPKRLQEVGFNWEHDLRAGLTAWKEVSKIRDFD